MLDYDKLKQIWLTCLVLTGIEKMVNQHTIVYCFHINKVKTATIEIYSVLL